MMVALGVFMSIICRGLGWIFLIITFVSWVTFFVRYDYIYFELFLWPALAFGSFYLARFFSSSEYFQ